MNMELKEHPPSDAAQYEAMQKELVELTKELIAKFKENKGSHLLCELMEVYVLHAPVDRLKLANSVSLMYEFRSRFRRVAQLAEKL